VCTTVDGRGEECHGGSGGAPDHQSITKMEGLQDCMQDCIIDACLLYTVDIYTVGCRMLHYETAAANTCNMSSR